MKNRISLSTKVVLSIVFMALAWWILTQQTAIYRYSDNKADHIQKFILKKQSELNMSLTLFKELYYSSDVDDKLLEKKLLADLSNQDVTVCVYKKDSLIFWSKNSNITEINNLNHLPGGKFFCHDKSWYLSEHLHLDSIYISVNFKVKKDFIYQNNILKNSFNDDIKLSPECVISKDRKIEPNIYGNNNEYLFSVTIPNSWNLPVGLENLFFVLFVFTIILAIYLFWCSIEKLKISFSAKIAIITIGVLVFRFVTLFKGWPITIYQSQLFDPGIYASSIVNPSLGDLFINTVLTLSLLLIVYNRVIGLLTKRKGVVTSFLFAALFIVSAWVIHYLFNTLIVNSTSDFLMYDFVKMNSVTLVGFITMILFLSCFSLVSRIVSVILCARNSLKVLIWGTVLTSFVCGVFAALFGYWNLVVEIGIFAVYFLSLLFLTNKGITYGFRFNLILIPILTFIGVFQIVDNQYYKQVSDSQLIAGNLANERDAVLESILPRLTTKLKSDTLLPAYLTDIDKNTQAIYTHITNTYLNGYINKYDIQITGCYSETNLIIDQAGRSEGCYSFFNDIINQSCIDVYSNNFYYNNNHNGRVSYLGRVRFPILNSSDSANIYIELDSKLANQYLGYPELLIQNPRTNIALSKGFSYANYNNKNLVAFNGDFVFPKSIDVLRNGSLTTNSHRLHNGNLEYIYEINSDNLIVIIKPFILGYKILYLLSHLFIGLYIIFLIMYYKPSVDDILSFFNSLNGRIKISIIGIILFSLAITSYGTLKYITSNYKKYHLESINEKVKSILIELNHKIDTRGDVITENKEYLDFWLVQLSNVFYTDINLYSTSGDLLASSREEIFEKDLICRKINREAKDALDDGEASFSCIEEIGKLKFSSVYVPLLNDNNRALAYLNIPYFTRQNELQSQLYQLINAGVNIFIILAILAVSVAVLISNRISKPIRLLQTALSDLSIGGENKMLNYNKRDEISQLVIAYNNKVEELQKSVEKLAEQEREDAWKKMSRQIAHEIKNPLTPMKLRVQFLERTLSENPEKMKEELKKFTKTMIQQIDSLTYIANQFANFSKLSHQNPTTLSPEMIISDVLNLYSKTKNITFSTLFNSSKNVISDKDNLPRVFINLIKNAIHSIPESYTGKIEIGFNDTDDNMVEFYVKDNGKGIDEISQERLFEPNFTTKTSGMGLGLPIVKSIIENSGGQIWFKTEKDKGTTFFFTLPSA